MSLEIVALSEAHALALWRNVVIQVWEGPTDPPISQHTLRLTLATFKRLRRQLLDQPLLAFSIVSPRASLPDPKSRAIAAEFPSYFDYFVGVHEGPEGRAAIVRTAIEAMALAARVEPRYELVTDLVRGCRALAGRSKRGIDANSLCEVVSELRTQIATAGAA